eukprot:4205067-Pyramimonas_sp.AAC.1
MRPPHPRRLTTHTSRGPINGLRRRPQWLRSHAPTAPLARIVAPQEARPKAPAAAFACAHGANFGTPLTRFMAT